jgi:hypothetical protein
MLLKNMSVISWWSIQFGSKLADKHYHTQFYPVELGMGLVENWPLMVSEVNVQK